MSTSRTAHLKAAEVTNQEAVWWEQEFEIFPYMIATFKILRQQSVDVFGWPNQVEW